MSKKIILLEYKEDTKYFIKNILPSLPKDSFLIIVLDDDAAFCLQEKSINFLHIEEFLSSKEEGILCEQCWQWLEKFCKNTDEYLVNNLSFLTKGAPFLASQIDVLKFIFDSIIIRITALKNIFNKLNPQEVYFAKSKLIQPKHSRLFYDESFSLFSVLLENNWNDFLQKDIKKYNWDSKYKIETSFNKETPLFTFLRLLKYLKNSYVEKRVDGVKNSNCLKVCLVGGRELSIQQILNDLKNNQALIYNWEPISAFNPAPLGNLFNRINSSIKGLQKYLAYKNKLKKIFNNLEKEKWFQKFFIWKEVSFYSIVKARIYFAITTQIAHQQVILEEAQKFIPYVDALISSYYLTFRRPVAFVAQQNKKKVISVQHGAMCQDVGGYGWDLEKNLQRASNKNYFYTDMASVDIKLVWGEGEAQDMKNWKFAEKIPEIIVYGAKHLKHLTSIKPQNTAEKKILFVGYVFGNNVFLLMNYRIYKYKINQYNILKSLAAVNSPHQLIYKDYKHWFRNEVFQVVKNKYPDADLKFVSHKESLLEILKTVDAVILDCPSTGLFEVCLTKLPIFVFNNIYTFLPEVKAMLKKRVYYSEDLKEFCTMMKELKTNPEKFPYLDDNEFVNKFVNVNEEFNIMNIFKKD